MFKQLLFAALLGVSLSSFAGSGGGFKSAVESAQQDQSSADTKQPVQLKSLSSDKQHNSAASEQDTDANKKPSMIDYCREHTC